MKVIRSKAGKTLEIRLELDGNLIKEVEISGDFMVFPSDAIEELERKLRGRALGEHEEVVREVLRKAELVGITEDDIIDAIWDIAGS
jgi:hypothetical protein